MQIRLSPRSAVPGATRRRFAGHIRPRGLFQLLGLQLLIVALSCRAVAPRLGANPASARTGSDDLFGSIGTRFSRVERDPKVRVGRRLIMRNLLTPSSIFDDTAAWVSAPNAGTRYFAYRGLADGDRYHFFADASTARPTRAAEGRSDMRLRKLDDDEYEWVSTAEFDIGTMTPATFASIPVAWIATGERADTAAIRSDLHTAFARSAAEWGRLFTLASIATSRDDSGAWTQHIVITLHPDRAGKTYPDLAKWLRSYISPIRMHMRLRDSTRTWFDAVVRNDSLMVTLRSRNGRVLPVEGGNTFLPDTAILETDFTAKLKFMRVGFQRLRAEFVSVRQTTARGWSLRFLQEPDWQLPPLAEQMLRTPLRRPFMRGGSSYRVVASTDGAHHTMMARRLVAPVHESAIYRFLSHLASGGISDYVEGADRDLNAWLSAAFRALRDDTNGVLATP